MLDSNSRLTFSPGDNLGYFVKASNQSDHLVFVFVALNALVSLCIKPIIAIEHLIAFLSRRVKHNYVAKVRRIRTATPSKDSDLGVV